MFIFGQGIMVIALTFFLRGVAGVLPMYVAEGRDEKILPNIAQTARFIWLVSLVYLVLGTLALGGVAWREGMPPVRAFLHGMWLFMAGWDTGGFAPQSQNILYYHSLTIEMVTIVIMLLGAMNFKLHHAIWNGDFKEVFKNIEMRTLFFSISLLSILCLMGLSYSGLYPQNVAIFRKGFYHLISAHTNTGYAALPTEQFITIWGHDAVLALILAMAIGGGASSTAGGIKLMRVGIIFKALLQEIKKLMSPEASIVIQKIHHLRDTVMEERQVRNAGLITLCFILLFILGTVAGVLAGYPFLESMFESVSASTNTGLSAGITAPSMPAMLKVTYIFQMWTGRLEFMSVLVFLGFIFALMAGK
jgi:trk system potassium uptake protein TrkH